MQRPLNLTLLITDLHLGGTPLLLRDLALALTASLVPGPHCFNVSVISLKPITDDLTIPQQLRAANISVHSLNMTSALSLPFALRRVRQLLDAQEPDLLYSMLIHANLVATLVHRRLKKKPKLIQSIHTLQPKPRWHWTLQGKISKRADAMIVPARPILDKLSAFGPLPPRATVIPNGIDVDRFANAAPIPPSELPWPAGSPIIGYVGRFDPVKNLPLLLHAFGHLLASFDQKNALKERGTNGLSSEEKRIPHLALVGYGSQEPELRALATSLHIAPHVHFLGPTTTPERWYKSFTFHCLPSAVEGFGLTVVESLAAGTPVLALETAVLKPLVATFPEATLLPIPATSETLSHAMKQLIVKYDAAPLGPTTAPSRTLLTLRSAFSTAAMAELHAKFFKNLLESSD